MQRRRWVIAMVTASLFTLAPLLAPPAAADWSDGACPTTNGVTVVVDFGRLGGGIVTRCAVGAQANGIAALTAAGFDPVPTTRFSGFVCRISAKPADDPCVDASPIDASWAYWQASRGGSWAYSTKGAGVTGTAPAGGVQGWSFSDGTNPKPGIAPPGPIPATTLPPAAAAPTSPPATNAPATNVPPAGGAGAGATTTIPVAIGRSATTIRGAAPAPTAPGSPPATAAPGEAVPVDPATTVPADADVAVLGESETAPTSTVVVSAASPDDPVTIELASGSDASDDGGSPIGALVGVAVVSAIGGAAFVIRRRRTPPA